MTLQLRAVGDTADIDAFVDLVYASGMRLVRLDRGLTSREQPGAERAYIHLEPAAAATVEGSAA